jgi:transposase InsO family protein
VKYAWIDANRLSYALNEMCGVLDVSISGFRAWKRGGTPERKRLTDAQMIALMKAIHEELKAAYGSPRMMRELRLRGFSAGKERAERLMRENGIRARHKRRYKVTTDSRHGRPSRRIGWRGSSHRLSQTRSGPRTSLTFGRTKAGCTWPLCSICSTGKWWAGRSSRK